MELRTAHPQCEVDLWSDVFQEGVTTLQNLRDRVDQADFAAFIFHPDDRGKARGKNAWITRDNVVFEYGLFLSQLGPERTFAVRPNMSLLAELTDVAGYTYLQYDLPPDPTPFAPKMIRTASLRIAERMRSLGPRSRELQIGMATRSPPGPFEWLRDLGITHTYLVREDAKGHMLQDILEAQSSVRLYARVYVSELVKDPRLAAHVATALKRAPGEFTLRSVACNYEDSPIVQQLHQIEDPWGRLSVDQYREHMRSAANYFPANVKAIRAAAGESASKLRAESRVFHNFLPPYSMVLVDERIAYVALYNPIGFGTHSRAIRLDRSKAESVEWLRDFLPGGVLADPPHVRTLSVESVPT